MTRLWIAAVCCVFVATLFYCGCDRGGTPRRVSEDGKSEVIELADHVGLVGVNHTGHRKIFSVGRIESAGRPIFPYSTGYQLGKVLVADVISYGYDRDSDIVYGKCRALRNVDTNVACSIYFSCRGEVTDFYSSEQAMRVAVQHRYGVAVGQLELLDQYWGTGDGPPVPVPRKPNGESPGGKQKSMIIR